MSPLPRALASDLEQANNQLLGIFDRMKQKYADHDAEQAASKNLPTSQDSRQSLDSTAGNIDPVDDNFRPFAEDSDDESHSRFAVGEDLLLSTRLNNLDLATLFAIKSAQGIQIGLSDFAAVVELPIEVDVAASSASGWFQRESNQFAIVPMPDGRLKATIGGRSDILSPDEYTLSDDLFIELKYFETWFGIKHELNEEQLKLTLVTTNKLPVELRLDRQKNANKIVSVAGMPSVLPLKESDYTVFSPPLLDIQLLARESRQVYQPRPNDINQSTYTPSQTSGSYSILASHDLAFLNAEIFLAGNDNDSLSDAWFTMSRQSEDADLLGPLAATEYAFGDISPVNAGMGRTQNRSLGFGLSNTPLNQVADNRRVNLTGELQVGWDVELYRNGVLIDQRIGVSEGRYEFNDVALEYGNNDFEFILYGPQGQIEKKTESYLVDANNVMAGEGQYRISVAQVGSSLFGVDNYSGDATDEGALYSSVFDYGVSDWLAFNIGAEILEPKLGDTEHFVSFGSDLNLGRSGLINARIQKNELDLVSNLINYRTRLGNTSLSLSASQREQFSQNNSDIYKVNTYNAIMSGQLFQGRALPISYQNIWNLSDSGSDETRNEYFQNSLGVGTRIGYFANNLTLQKDAYQDPVVTTLDPLVNPLDDSLLIPIKQDSLTGSALYRKNFGRLHTRLFGNYAIKPVEELYSYGGAFNYSWSNDFNTELRYTEYVLSDLYQLNLAMNWRKDTFYLSGNAGYNESGSWSAGIGLRFSLGYEPLGRSVFTSGRPIAQSGAVAARVFEDLNMNGVYDADEPVISGAKVKAVQGYRQSETNQDGVAVISALSNNVITDIVVDESTLDGPFMIRTKPGMAIRARKGYLETVDLPVAKAGELDGIVYLHNQDGQSEPAAYVSLNLVDKNSEVVATTRSEFDGYYIFTNVLPGAYDLKVDENYIERLGLKESAKNLDFSSQGDVIKGVDFVLHPLDQAQGYIASAGEFKNPNMLKLYYQILRNKIGENFVQTPFYIKKPNKEGYILGLAYYPGNPVSGRAAEMNTLSACKKLAPFNTHCDVQYHDFKY